MKKQNLQSRPPKISSELEAFIEGAEVKKLKLLRPLKSKISTDPDRSSNIITQEPKEFPWDDQSVRIDVKKIFSLRLSEPDMLKLQFIQKMTNKSMQKFCLEHLIPAIETEIKKLKNWQL